MALSEITPVPSSTSTKGPDPDVIRVLFQVCEDLQADELERRALFQAAIVASKLRNEPDAGDDRVGVFAQNPFWGPAVARRDPYTAADVFLREARRLRTPEQTSAAKLAALVQGGSARRHALAGRKADRIIAGGRAQSSSVMAG
jgi:hypothetical protein